jgi:hypothetical protein
MALTLRRTLLLGTIALLSVPSSALALVHVPAGQRVGEITVIADDVRVDGAVTGSVSVIDGSLIVGPHGRLDDRAVVIGGTTTIIAGGRIRGDVFQFGSRWPLPEGRAAVAVIAALVAARLLAVWLALSFARILARRSQAAAVIDELRSFPLRTVIVGLVAALGLVALSVLCAITVIGLVAAAAIWGLLLVAAVLGIAVLLCELGDEPRTVRLLGVTLLVPLLGELVVALATIVALGGAARALARAGDDRRRSGLARS